MRTLPDGHIAFSVLISFGNSSGSGFLYNSEKNVYLVTAKHVLFDEKINFRSEEIEILCQSTDPSFNSHRYRLELKKTVIDCHKIADVALVLLGKITERKVNGGITFTHAKGIEIIVKGQRNPVLAARENVNLFDDVMISNDVFVFGYPTSLGIQESIQFDLNKPLLRKGIVANTFNSAKTIILDCPVYGGNSGGPVTQVVKEDGEIKFRLIGVISQFIPFVQRWKNERDRIVHLEYLNSGYSVASSMDFVLEIIEKMEKE